MWGTLAEKLSFIQILFGAMQPSIQEKNARKVITLLSHTLLSSL